jgi:GntR family transcriptional regulator/MocR family aminotransferase
MARKASSLPLNLPPPRTGENKNRWLYAALRASILQGQLPVGMRLPATRDLASAYGLSRATIVTAFDQLKAEGYVEGVAGSGTFVSDVLPEHLLEAGRPRPAKKLSRLEIPQTGYASRLRPARAARATKFRAFRPNLPALDHFPTSLWAQVAARRLRQVSVQLLAGGDPTGYRPLREAVASYLNTSRGVKCVPEQVLIVSGAQEALDRTARLLLEPGHPVWMEEPGYPGAAAVFEAAGATICPVPVDAEGLVLQAGRERYGAPRLVYLTPAHQFPMGFTMSARRRVEILEWARQAGTILFEDDYDSEFRYGGRPIPALQGMDRSGSVIFAGSFSAVLFPSLRLGYMVVPPDLVEMFAAAAAVTTQHPPILDQAILCDFITEGHFARHIRRMRELYAERHAVFVEAVEHELGGVVAFPNVEAGMQMVGWLEAVISIERVVERAAKRNLEIVPLSEYAWGRTGRGRIVFGFAGVEPREIRRGVAELARVIDGLRWRRKG